MGSVGMEGTSEHQAREHQVSKVMAVRMPSLEIHRKWNPGGPGKAIAPRWRRVLGICPVWFRVILWNTGNLGHSALDSREQYNSRGVSLEVALHVSLTLSYPGAQPSLSSSPGRERSGYKTRALSTLSCNSYTHLI